MLRTLFRPLCWFVLLIPIPAYSDQPEKSSLANSHPDYLALRNARLGQSFSVNAVTLTRDVGVFHLTSGTVTFLEPVLGKTVVALFSGEGEFRLQPATTVEAGVIELYTQQPDVREAFKEAVFCFTDDTDREIREGGQAGPPGGAAEILERFRKRMRRRRENPRSFTEAIFTGADMDNIEADLLSGLLNPQRPKFFSAYLRGERFRDLRFHLRPLGGVPQMLSPEEVALINFNPEGRRDGIWYLTHLKSKHDSGTASSREDKRVIDVTHYDIEAGIASNRELSAEVRIDFRALRDGARVVKFGLLPTLRVSEVAFRGQPIHFVQSGKREDAGFYLILPAALQRNGRYRVKVRYAGDEVIHSAGGGNFAVGARSSWYPSIGSFRDRATYETRFTYPKRYLLAGVGDRIEEGKDGKLGFSRWKSKVPLKVAGFNYGDFNKITVKDKGTGTVLEGFATNRVPDFLRQAEMSDAQPRGTTRERTGIPGGAPKGRLSPKRLMQRVVQQSQASTRLFTRWFGPLPYGRVAITQQPQFGFGQSWPTLIYLPVSGFMDQTQRWALLGRDTFNFSNFVQEVTPHEVAHQWWGHLVGWATYHDQWISEGFAEFSSLLYLQASGEQQKFIDLLRRWREAILEKNRFGHSANDVGPLWMGSRLNTPRTESAYQRLVYSKGGFVLHMLRQIMHDPRKGDQPFMAMMQDFVKTHHNQDASTESFKAVVEKHMTPEMDLDRNGAMDWFFNQWVYGSEMPSYELTYTLTPVRGGKARLKGRLTQSEVSESFKMMVPIYLQNRGRLIRLGRASVGGASSLELDVPLPSMPEKVLINPYHDVLARNVSIRRQ